MMNVLPKVVHHLYNCDILDEQVIVQWYQTKPEPGEVEEHQQVRRQVSALCCVCVCVCVLSIIHI